LNMNTNRNMNTNMNMNKNSNLNINEYISELGSPCFKVFTFSRPWEEFFALFFGA
jgi:hypothetical protein